jgi:DNA-binding response OmpR family regulator
MKDAATVQQTKAFSALQLALPKDQSLIRYDPLYTLTLLHTSRDDPPCILTQKQFTASEWQVLVLLLESYPFPVLYEQLFATLYHTTVEQGRKQIHKAKVHARLKAVLRPLRDIISTIRSKIGAFPFIITTQQGVGYSISVLSPGGDIVAEQTSHLHSSNSSTKNT